MPRGTSERVPCDCKLQHSNLVAVSTRCAHRRTYGVRKGGFPTFDQVGSGDEDGEGDDVAEGGRYIRRRWTGFRAE